MRSYVGRVRERGRKLAASHSCVMESQARANQKHGQCMGYAIRHLARHLSKSKKEPIHHYFRRFEHRSLNQPDFNLTPCLASSRKLFDYQCKNCIWLSLIGTYQSFLSLWTFPLHLPFKPMSSFISHYVKDQWGNISRPNMGKNGDPIAIVMIINNYGILVISSSSLSNLIASVIWLQVIGRPKL